MKRSDKLSMAQVQADLYAASDAIARATSMDAKAAKYIKGLAGYHLQQAAEKMIKLQLYTSGHHIDNQKIYRHSLDELLLYADALGLEIVCPPYVYKQKTIISAWESQGRYDLHFAVRIDQLKKCFSEETQWFDQMKQLGYR